jgi:hypothetical protein
LGGDDSALEAIWKQCHSLAEIVSTDKFKSTADLQKQLERVLGAPVGDSVQEQEQSIDRVAQNTENEDLIRELENTYRKPSSTTSEETELLDQFKDLIGDDD